MKKSNSILTVINQTLLEYGFIKINKSQTYPKYQYISWESNEILKDIALCIYVNAKHRISIQMNLPNAPTDNDKENYTRLFGDYLTDKYDVTIGNIEQCQT